MDPIGSIKFLAVTTAAAATYVLSPVALAEDSSSPVSRAEVKAQTRSANKARELLPPGETSPPEKPFMSEKTRIDRKLETKAARKEGQLLPSGQAEYKANVAPSPRSDKTRAERKAETLAAAKAGKLIPAGERGDAATK